MDFERINQQLNELVKSYCEITGLKFTPIQFNHHVLNGSFVMSAHLGKIGKCNHISAEEAAYIIVREINNVG